MGLGRTFKKIGHKINKKVIKPVVHTGKKTVSYLDDHSGSIVKALESEKAFEIYGAILGSTAGSVLDIGGPLGIAADIAIGEATSQAFGKLHDKYVKEPKNNKGDSQAGIRAIQIHGKGDYFSNTKMSNIFHNNEYNWQGGYGTNPLIEFSGDDNPVVIEKREYCFDVITSGGYLPTASQPFPIVPVTQLTNQQYSDTQFNGPPPQYNNFYEPGSLFKNTTAAVNPGLSVSNGGIFTWLPAIGIGFQNYIIDFMEFEFIPTCGEYGPSYSPIDAVTNGNGNNPNFRGPLGSVILAIQYDSTADPYTSQEEAMNSEAAVLTQSNKPVKFRVETSRREQPYRLFLVRQSDFTQSQQPDLYDIGRLNVISQGYPTPNVSIGKIYVTYSVSFQKFRPSTSSRQTRTASYYVVDVDPSAPTTGGFSSSSPLGLPDATHQGLVPTEFNQIELSFDYPNGRIFFPPLMSQGEFQLTLKWVAASASYPNVDNMPNDGVQYLPIGNNVRTVNCMSTNRTGLGAGVSVTQDKTFFMGQNFSNAGPLPVTSQEVAITMFVQVTGQGAFIQLPIGNNVWQLPTDIYWLSLIMTELNASANPGRLQTAGST
jgi:hypothetical protein